MNFEHFQARIVSPALQAVAAHWDAARGARLMPSYQQLKPSRIAAQLSIVWVYKYDRATGAFTGRLAGDRIIRGFGKSFRGLTLEEIHPPQTLPTVYDCLNRIVSEPALFGSRGKLFRHGERIGMGERIVLPLASDGVAVDGVIGASDYANALDNFRSTAVELIREGEHWAPLVAVAA